MMQGAEDGWSLATERAAALAHCMADSGKARAALQHLTGCFNLWAKLCSDACSMLQPLVQAYVEIWIDCQATHCLSGTMLCTESPPPAAYPSLAAVILRQPSQNAGHHQKGRDRSHVESGLSTWIESSAAQGLCITRDFQALAIKEEISTCMRMQAQNLAAALYCEEAVELGLHALLTRIHPIDSDPVEHARALAYRAHILVRQAQLRSAPLKAQPAEAAEQDLLQAWRLLGDHVRAGDRHDFMTAWAECIAARSALALFLADEARRSSHQGASASGRPADVPHKPYQAKCDSQATWSRAWVCRKAAVVALSQWSEAHASTTGIGPLSADLAEQLVSLCAELRCLAAVQGFTDEQQAVDAFLPCISQGCGHQEGAGHEALGDVPGGCPLSWALCPQPCASLLQQVVHPDATSPDQPFSLSGISTQMHASAGSDSTHGPHGEECSAEQLRGLAQAAAAELRHKGGRHTLHRAVLHLLAAAKAQREGVLSSSVHSDSCEPMSRSSIVLS
jgi:hypothetical protein